MTTEPGQEKAGWPVVKLERSLSPNRRQPERVLNRESTCPSRAFEIETYLPESAVTGLVEAVERSLDVLGTGQCPVNECPGCKYETAEVRAELEAALSAFKQEVERG